MTQREFSEATTLTLGQLARIAGIANNRTMLRLLLAGGVKVLRVGRRHVIERIELERTMPALYESLLLRTESIEQTHRDW